MVTVSNGARRLAAEHGIDIDAMARRVAGPFVGVGDVKREVARRLARKERDEMRGVSHQQKVMQGIKPPPLDPR